LERVAVVPEPWNATRTCCTLTCGAGGESSARFAGGHGTSAGAVVEFEVEEEQDAAVRAIAARSQASAVRMASHLARTPALFKPSRHAFESADTSPNLQHRLAWQE
jgi:hypothetical protein